MISRKQAEKAKETLHTQLCMHDWFSGIALGLSGTGVSVRVAIVGEITDDIIAAVPKTVDGVAIILEQAIPSTPFDPKWLK